MTLKMIGLAIVRRRGGEQVFKVDPSWPTGNSHQLATVNFRSSIFLKGALFFVCLTVLFFLGSGPVWADNSPRLNNGEKWRIGYYEGGPFSDYMDTMRTTVRGLIELGWIKGKIPRSYAGDVPKPYWDWLIQCDSPYLSFRPVDAYSADWDVDRRKEIREELLKRLKKGELDLMLAMGTWAGQDLANNKHSVPTMVLSTSDPIRAGIIKSADDSGLDHVTARVDPERYLRQIRMFHRIVGFKTLGVAYENTEDGRIYSAVDEINSVARERGFKVIWCEVIDTTTDLTKADQSCLSCYRQLAQEAEAVYLTALTCVDRLAPEIAEIFRAAKAPSFSMIGSKFVKDGIMLSISSDSGYTELGRYQARKLDRILNGTKPRDLEQVLKDPLEIAVNLKTIRLIGFDMPEGILRVATEKYEK